MAYCSKQDMVDRFGSDELIALTDRSGSGIIDDSVLNQAIADASAEIDGYLGRYTLPLSTTPVALVRLCADMARYYLYDESASEQIVRRYEAAVKWLSQVSAGKIRLSADISGSEPQSGQVAVMQSDGRVFNRKHHGFI